MFPATSSWKIVYLTVLFFYPDYSYFSHPNHGTLVKQEKLQSCLLRREELLGLHKVCIGLSRALNTSHFLLDWFLGSQHGFRGGVITTSTVLSPLCAEFLFYSVVILAWFPNLIWFYIKDGLKYNKKCLSWNIFFIHQFFRC